MSSNISILLVSLLFTLPHCSVPDEPRIWKSSDGQFSVEAELVCLENGEVQLLKKDGSKTRVAVTELCRDDLLWLLNKAQIQNEKEEFGANLIKSLTEAYKKFENVESQPTSILKSKAREEAETTLDQVIDNEAFQLTLEITDVSDEGISFLPPERLFGENGLVPNGFDDYMRVSWQQTTLEKLRPGDKLTLDGKLQVSLYRPGFRDLNRNELVLFTSNTPTDHRILLTNVKLILTQRREQNNDSKTDDDQDDENGVSGAALVTALKNAFREFKKARNEKTVILGKQRYSAAKQEVLDSFNGTSYEETLKVLNIKDGMVYIDQPKTALSSSGIRNPNHQTELPVDWPMDIQAKVRAGNRIRVSGKLRLEITNSYGPNRNADELIIHFGSIPRDSVYTDHHYGIYLYDCTIELVGK